MDPNLSSLAGSGTVPDWVQWIGNLSPAALAIASFLNAWASRQAVKLSRESLRRQIRSEKISEGADKLKKLLSEMVEDVDTGRSE